MNETPTATTRHNLREVLGKIAWELDNDVIPPGEVAALRRLRPDQPGGPAFWKIAVRHLEPAELLADAGAPWRDEEERRWAMVLAGMAEMKGLHRPGRALGRVLAEAEVSEARVLRLLRAQGEDALAAAVRAVVHQLASGGHRVDWHDLAELIRSAGRPFEGSVRRRIATDYYRHLTRH